MWPFKKRKKKEEQSADSEEDDQEEEQPSSGGGGGGGDGGLATKVEMLGADITKIQGNIESFKEMRKSTSERFATINEQMGEIRGQVTDVQRSVGTIEVKATKAADLVESVHPDKLMIQVQKEDGKIEGLRGMLEAKEEMIKNVMDQLKKMRDQMGLFRGVEQLIKLNEEVKDELMNVKKVAASVERHADRVDNVFIEAQKSFQAFNTFSDKLDSQKADLKELQGKIDKLEAGMGTFMKKKEFEDRIEKIEKHDKKVKKVLEDMEKYYNKLDEKFGKMEGKLRGEFEFKIEKAELMSKAFEDLLHENPLFAKGLDLEKYLKKHMEGAPAEASSEAKAEGGGGASGGEGGEEAKEGEGEAKEGNDAEAEGGEEKKDGEAGGDKPDAKATEGMEPVKK